MLSTSACTKTPRKVTNHFGDFADVCGGLRVGILTLVEVCNGLYIVIATLADVCGGLH